MDLSTRIVYFLAVIALAPLMPIPLILVFGSQVISRLIQATIYWTL